MNWDIWDIVLCFAVGIILVSLGTYKALAPRRRRVQEERDQKIWSGKID